MNIILIGPPGCGKSTQAKKLAEELGLKQISGGDVSRSIAKTNPNAKKIIDEGGLIPDELLWPEMEKLIVESQQNGGFVIDGYPRNSDQLVPFEKLEKDANIKIDKVIIINLSDEEGTKRILQRAVASGRGDDNPESIAHRYQVYHQNTDPVIEHYRSLGLSLEIDGRPSIDDVHKQVMEKLTAVSS